MPAPASPARSPRRRLTAVLAGLTLALMTIEAALQVASFLAWQGQQSTDRPDGRVVLCIGDSLTFGLCAEPEESYPERLRHHLASQGQEWSTVNAGVPGQNSADILQRLPKLLADLQPEVVVLLFGWNDTWSRPAPWDAAAAPDDTGFPLRWRTGRLLAAWLAEDDLLLERDPPPFLGSWHVLEHEFYFAPDGAARLGPLPARWKLEGDVLQITPEHGAPFSLRWRRAESSLEFAMLGWDRFQRARRGPPTGRVDLDRIEDMIRRREIDAAIAAVQALGVTPEAVAARAHATKVLIESGNPERATAFVQTLESAWADTQDASAGEALARWLQCRGETARASQIARRLLDDRPDRIACWRVLVDSCPAPARAALAAELAALAVRQASPWRQAELVLERAVVMACVAPAEAIAGVQQARAMGIGPDETIAALARAVRNGANREQLLLAAETARLHPHEAAALVRDVRRAVVDEDAVLTVLERHLQIATDLVKSAGARPVLLGYPFAMPRHEAIVQRVAAATGAKVVSLVDTFDRELATGSRGDWFADPIHCTARGYDLMARELARNLASERH